MAAERRNALRGRLGRSRQSTVPSGTEDGTNERARALPGMLGSFLVTTLQNTFPQTRVTGPPADPFRPVSCTPGTYTTPAAGAQAGARSAAFGGGKRPTGGQNDSSGLRHRQVRREPRLPTHPPGKSHIDTQKSRPKCTRTNKNRLASADAFGLSWCELAPRTTDAKPRARHRTRGEAK